MARQQPATTTPTSKHAGGRPTKLTRAMVTKAATYLDECKMGRLYAGDLPTIEGLSLYLDVRRSTIYEWEKSATPLGVEFSDTVDKVKATQAYKLIGKSLKGEYNAAISKLLLSNHGYVEKQEVDTKLTGDVSFINDVPRPKKR